MSIIKEKTIDRMEILENGVIQIREITRIIEDGVIISRTFHRYVLAPGVDISSEPQKIKDLAGFIWTQDVKDAYLASLQAEK